MGLTLRHDNGPQYISGHCQNEVVFHRIESSPSLARSPQGNESAERFIRTHTEQLLRIRRFETAEELRCELTAFKERLNRHWLLQRHSHRIPAQVRTAHLAEPAIAA
ncbi:hypothetical protein [Thioalkalivibrio sp. ALE19]|uniref:hypothetical protein n=1 Tax=Thioalkalivibrio sp. ALE19 TaxID=1266909 RepID=UPI000686A55D|nr:hypothetical protein [Thioalkalivibrio sp. ALE19]